MRYLLLIVCLAAFHVEIYSQHCSGCQINAARRARAERRLTIPQNQRNRIIRLHNPLGLHTPPVGAQNERMILQREWVTWYDDDLRMPLWVSYFLSRRNAQSSRVRRNCFRVDQRLPGSAASNCQDYNEPIFDRGHMVPRNDLSRSTTAQDNSFLFSNMAPQHANFNRLNRVWQTLEAWVNAKAEQADGIHIITGAVFDRDGTTGRDRDTDAVRMAPTNRVGVPSHFYKILFKIRPNEKIDIIAFLLPHNNRRRGSRRAERRYFGRRKVSIRQIEAVTGITFFPDHVEKPDAPVALKDGKARSINRWFTY